MEREVEQLQFLGPGGSFFESFDQQVTYFLDIYCRGWRDYENPSCHLIPPTFEYSWPEISDEDVKNLQPGNYKDRILSDNLGQGSEHIVHRAIQKAAHEGIAAPFLAIRNLTVHDGSKKILELIFPNIPWQRLEIDFLLIGPKIGLIIIEVKGGLFNDKKKDFSQTNLRLPDAYRKGLMVLEKIEKFTSMVAEECLKIPPLPVRKIIFTPNLERKRFGNWYQNLPTENREALNQELAILPNDNNKDNNLVQQFIKEDMEIGVTETSPLLFQALKELLQATNSEIPFEVYEANAKFLAGLSSINVKNGKDISLQEEKLSAVCSMLMDNIRIGMQNPVREGKQLEKASSHIRISKSGAMKEVFKKLQIMYLTPEQLSVMHGGARQLIIGAAGTGKTILLQAKAMELMSRGEKVVVFAEGPLRWHYKMVFDQERLTNYEIGDWQYFIRQFFDSSKLETHTEELFMLLQQYSSEILSSIVFGEHPSKTNALFSFLWKELPEGHLFFDEAIASVDSSTLPDGKGSYNFLLSLLYTKTGREPMSTVWITLDPISISWTEDLVGILETFVLSIQHLLGFSLSYLDKVIRSSEEVFKHFPKNILRVKTMLIPNPPISGHKIQGIIPIIKEGNFPSEEEAVENLLAELPNILKSISCHDWPENSIGISLHGALLKSKNYLRLHPLLDMHLPENGFDLLYPVVPQNGQIVYPASMPYLPYLIQEKLYWYIQPVIPHQVKYTGSKVPADIVRSIDITSLEWPVVISLSIILHSTAQPLIDQSRYMNRSRARITFIEISYTYDVQTLVTCGKNVETKLSTLNPTKNFLSSLLGSFFKFGCNGKLISSTVEQMAILQGAKRQIIVGGVSTGKTTVLQMKAIELLEKGEKVVLFAPLLLRQQYKWIFDSRGLKNYILFSWLGFMDEFRKSPGAVDEKTLNDWLWEIVGLTRSGQRCSSSNGLYSVLCKEFHGRHVFLEEFLEDFTIHGRWEIAHALIALAVQESGREQYIWVALDQTRFKALSSWFYFYEKYFGFFLSYLNDIMNMTEGVYKALELSESTRFFDRILRIRSSPIIYNLHFSFKEDAIEHLLTKGFRMVLESFVGPTCSEISGSQIGVLVLRNILWHRDMLERIEKIILEMCPNVNAGVIPPTTMDEHDRYYFMQKYWTPETIQAYFSGRLSSDFILENWPRIVICSVEDATSFRWRRIIILSVLPACTTDTRYQRYIRSRAIETFAELAYVYGPEETSEAQSGFTINKAEETQSDVKMEKSIIWTHLDSLYNVELEALGQIPDTSAILKLQVEEISDDQMQGDSNLKYFKSSTPKGLALLICNNQFYDNDINRTGAYVDLINMQILFRKLGYVIHTKIDRTAKDMLYDVAEFVTLFDEKPVDSCIIAVMTLGITGDLMGIDGTMLDVGEFLKPVKQNNALVNKAKLFIIHADRPNGLKTPISDEEKPDILSLIKRAESESMEAIARNLPCIPDTIVIFSTTPSYFSRKKSERGSWFIQTICEVFAEHAHEMDVVSLAHSVVSRYSKTFRNQLSYLSVPHIYLNMRKKFTFSAKVGNTSEPKVCPSHTFVKQALEVGMNKLYVEFNSHMFERFPDFDVVALLPELIPYQIIDFNEKARVEQIAREKGPVEACTMLFRQIMPLKDMQLHKCLVEVFQRKSWTDTAYFLQKKLEGIENTPRYNSPHPLALQSSLVSLIPWRLLAQYARYPSRSTTNTNLPSGAHFLSDHYHLEFNALLTLGTIKETDKILSELLTTLSSLSTAAPQQKSQRRGLAMIINNQKYSVLQERRGSHIDAINMYILLNQLGYDVCCKLDRRAQDLLIDAKEFVDHFQNQKGEGFRYRSCIVVILTYAAGGHIIGVDNEKRDQREFMSIITGCKALEHIPKLFIIQACRTSVPTPGQNRNILSEIARLQENAYQEIAGKIPGGNNISVFYSVTPGYHSWKNEERGSLFIQAVCEVFAAHCRSHDLCSLATEVWTHIGDRFQESKHLKDIFAPRLHYALTSKFCFHS